MWPYLELWAATKWGSLSLKLNGYVSIRYSGMRRSGRLTTVVAFCWCGLGAENEEGKSSERLRKHHDDKWRKRWYEMERKGSTRLERRRKESRESTSGLTRVVRGSHHLYTLSRGNDADANADVKGCSVHARPTVVNGGTGLACAPRSERVRGRRIRPLCITTDSLPSAASLRVPYVYKMQKSRLSCSERFGHATGLIAMTTTVFEGRLSFKLQASDVLRLCIQYRRYSPCCQVLDSVSELGAVVGRDHQNQAVLAFLFSQA